MTIVSTLPSRPLDPADPLDLRPQETRFSPRLARVLSVSQKVQSPTGRKPAQVLGRAAFRTGAAWVQFGALPGVPGAACGECQSGGVSARPPHPGRTPTPGPASSARSLAPARPSRPASTPPDL